MTLPAPMDAPPMVTSALSELLPFRTDIVFDTHESLHRRIHRTDAPVGLHVRVHGTSGWQRKTWEQTPVMQYDSAQVRGAATWRVAAELSFQPALTSKILPYGLQTNNFKDPDPQSDSEPRRQVVNASVTLMGQSFLTGVRQTLQIGYLLNASWRWKNA